MTPPPASTAAARLAAAASSNPSTRRDPSRSQLRTPRQRARASSIAGSGVQARLASGPAPSGQAVITTAAPRSEARPSRSIRPAPGAIPRRISGAVAGMGTSAASGFSAIASAAAVAVPARPLRNPERAQEGLQLGRRVLSVVASAPDHEITRRVSGGRAWIALLAVSLIGIVFLQVLLLDVNAGIGRDVSSVTKLQRQNAELRSEVSALGSESRVVAQAQRMGFVEPPVGSSRFVAAGGGDAAAAQGTIVAPVSGAGSDQQVGAQAQATDGGGSLPGNG